MFCISYFSLKTTPKSNSISKTTANLSFVCTSTAVEIQRCLVTVRHCFYFHRNNSISRPKYKPLTSEYGKSLPVKTGQWQLHGTRIQMMDPCGRCYHHSWQFDLRLPITFYNRSSLTELTWSFHIVTISIKLLHAWYDGGPTRRWGNIRKFTSNR